MSDRQTLLKIISGAEKKLTRASQRLSDIPRPPNACSAHDDIFAASAAQTDALLALLACESARINDGEQENPPRLLWRIPLLGELQVSGKDVLAILIAAFLFVGALFLLLKHQNSSLITKIEGQANERIK